MLDGLDRHRFPREAGLVLDSSQMRHGRRNLEAAQIRPLETDARIRRRGLQREGHFVAGMKTDSGARHRSTKSTLDAHDLSDDRWDSRPELSKRPATNCPQRVSLVTSLNFNNLAAVCDERAGTGRASCGQGTTTLSIETVVILPQLIWLGDASTGTSAGHANRLIWAIRRGVTSVPRR
jgi:hypothetical protein